MDSLFLGSPGPQRLFLNRKRRNPSSKLLIPTLLGDHSEELPPIGWATVRSQIWGRSKAGRLGGTESFFWQDAAVSHRYEEHADDF